MTETNFDILGISENSSRKEIQEAFRKLALQHHSDRGGSEEYFKKIKQAYEDLKIGKKYPDTDTEKKRKSKVFSGDDEEQVRRRNEILGREISKEMKVAEEWAGALNRSNATGTRLFGSKSLGEIELERKANGALSIKGNFMAGSLTYDGPIIMQGNISSPTWAEEYQTKITLKKGDFKFVNPLENKYKIENGAKIIAENGDIIVGNIFGRIDKVQDPDGRVGIYLTRELRTSLSAPKGKIIVENVVNTVSLNADSIIVLNLEDNITIEAKEILIYGHKITYDVEIKLKKQGFIRFFETFSIQGLSDDAIIFLENGKSFRLHDLKTRKIRDIPEEYVPKDHKFDKNDTLVGKGFTITYDLLDNFNKKSEKKKKNGWSFKLTKST